jgi:hypothetical protein
MLKPYLGFSREAGTDGAGILIFAHTAREARKIGWDTDITDEYIDFAATRMRRTETYLMTLANATKLDNDEPHSVWDVPFCKNCEQWGEPIGDDGFCESCAEDLNLRKGGVW